METSDHLRKIDRSIRKDTHRLVWLTAAWIVFISLCMIWESHAQNVGVGLAAPNTKLDVQTSALTHDGLEIEHTNASYDPIIKFTTNATNRFAAGVDNTDDHFKINTGTSISTTVPDFSINDQGYVGLNEDDALARFHVENGAVLFRGNTGTTPVSGAGRRFMYIPAKFGAMRVGYVSGTQWDDANIGDCSFAGGESSIASGHHAFAFGDEARALGNWSVAIGGYGSPLASGFSSYAFGNYSQALGNHSWAAGHMARATGWHAVALTAHANAMNDYTFAVGTFADANAYYSTVIGHSIDCNDSGSVVIADGDVLSRVLGYDLTTDYFQFASKFRNGYRFHTSSLAVPAVTISPTSTVGIGTGNVLAAYKLEVQDNVVSNYVASFFNDGNSGNRYGVRIQAGEDLPAFATPNYYLRCFDGDGTEVGGLRLIAGTFDTYTVSDARLKTNVSNTAIAAASILNALRVVDYNWKDRTDEAKTTGFLAQEVQQVFPEMVSVDNGPGMITDQLTVSPGKLIPVLVKGYQELYEQTRKENETLRAELAATRAMLENLSAKVEEITATTASK